MEVKGISFLSFKQTVFKFVFLFFVFCFNKGVLFFFLKELLYLLIYLFIFGCVGSSFLCEGFL